MKIYHPKLKVVEDVNDGLAKVLIRDGGWEKATKKQVADEEKPTQEASE